MVESPWGKGDTALLPGPLGLSSPLECFVIAVPPGWPGPGWGMGCGQRR